MGRFYIQLMQEFLVSKGGLGNWSLRIAVFPKKVESGLESVRRCGHTPSSSPDWCGWTTLAQMKGIIVSIVRCSRSRLDSPKGTIHPICPKLQHKATNTHNVPHFSTLTPAVRVVCSCTHYVLKCKWFKSVSRVSSVCSVSSVNSVSSVDGVTNENSARVNSI